MSARLASVIRRILRAPGGSGMARVVAYDRPGAVRLEGRPEPVLVAGNAVPAVGELVPWLRVDEGTLVTSRNIPAPLIAPASSPAIEKQWEQARVNFDTENLGVMLAHRDSSGRWWVKARRFTPAYYSQENDDFLTPDWSYRGTGLGTNSEAADRSSVMGDGDAFVEVGQSGSISLAARRIEISPLTGALSYGSLHALPDRPEGTPYRSAVCKDSWGRYHVAAWWSYPYLTDPPKWREVAWRSAPESVDSWEQTLNVLHDCPPDSWRIPALFPLDGSVVKLGAQRVTVDGEVYDAIRYRIFDGGWSGEMDPGFRGETIAGVGGADLHIAYRDAGGAYLWRRATRLGAGLFWEDSAALLDSDQGALGALHRNHAEGSAPVAAWVTNSDREFWRYGLPPGGEAEDLESPDPLAYAISNGALQAGGESEAAQRNGFAAFLQYRTIYAARIVEAEA